MDERRIRLLGQPVSDVIRKRFSSRSYLREPIDAKARQQLADFAATLRCGPLGTPARFMLIAASADERDALKSLGTYGFIRNPTGFIVGAVQRDAKDLEDFGYLMEEAVLQATDLGIGSCWLGGSFTRSSFSRKIALQASEIMPAVTSIGYSASPDGAKDSVRRMVNADSRLPWEDLFFEDRFGKPLARELAGDYAAPLEAVRLGPSASNKQPWRVIKDGEAWHFYLQRTKGYRDQLGARLLQVEDLQRVDMGIAMSHFELAAAELGLSGCWALADPALAVPDALTEYAVTWIGQ